MPLSDLPAGPPHANSRVDVLLFLRRSMHSEDHLKAWKADPPIQERFELHEGVAIEILPKDECDEIMRVCRSVRYDHAPVEPIYAFTAPAGLPRRWDQQGRWDARNRISNALTLARLVCPTDTGFDLSATLTYDSKGQLGGVAPSEGRHWASWAWKIPGQHKLWLTRSDAERLREVQLGFMRVERLLSNTPLGDAFFRFSVCPYMNELQIRLVAGVATLERLVCRGAERVSAQFRERIPALAKRVRIGRSKRWAERVYGMRSKPAHGVRFYVPYEGTYQEIEEARDKMRNDLDSSLIEVEDLARTVLAQALVDADLQSLLLGTGPETVETLWPVPPKVCATCATKTKGAKVIECPHCKERWPSKKSADDQS
jgi:hypothetical protein